MVTNYFWFDGSGRIEIELTQAQINSVCCSGANDAAVAAEIKPAIDAELLRNALKEYGAWDENELADHSANLDRVFWIACWDCYEDPNFYAAG